MDEDTKYLEGTITVKSIVNILADYSEDKWSELEKLLYHLFFHIEGVYYHKASSLLTKAGVENKCGERDIFGPLSWGVKTSLGWVWFG